MYWDTEQSCVGHMMLKVPTISQTPELCSSSDVLWGTSFVGILVVS